MPKSAYPQGIAKSIHTMILPKPLVDCMRAIKRRTGIPANAIAALAIDEFLQRSYAADLSRAIAGEGIVDASEHALRDLPEYAQEQAGGEKS